MAPTFGFTTCECIGPYKVTCIGLYNAICTIVYKIICVEQNKIIVYAFFIGRYTLG